MRLPKDFRFDSDEVYVTRMGAAIVLMSKEDSWDYIFNIIDEFSDDFMEIRDQPTKQQIRDLDFES